MSGLREEIVALESLVLSVPEKNFSAILQQCVESAVRLSGADRVSLIQFDEASRQVRHFSRGGPGWVEVLAAIEYDELIAGLSGWALRTGQIAVSPAGVPDPRESEPVQRRRRETNCGSILVAPLGGPSHLGTLTLINHPDQGDFSALDVENLELYSKYLTMVLLWALEREASTAAQTAAQTAVRSKTQYLSNLSHELRTPLNGVLGFSSLLEASVTDPNHKSMAGTILQSGQRLLSTVDNLLELARFEAGDLQLESVPFSPRAVLEAVAARHRSGAVEKNLSWHISADEGIPPVLKGDSVRLGQAWDHILSNAVKFTDRGGVDAHLEARRAHGRLELILLVTDTGIGFTGGRTGQWFMPFHQEDGSLTRKFGGTGLGLALSDRIVRMMGGGLSLLGEPGVGTKVRVWVDLSLNAEAKPPLRVLVEDGDQDEARHLVRLLEAENYRADFVPSFDTLEERDSPGYELLIARTQPPAALLRRLSEHPVPLIALLDAGEAPRGAPWTTNLAKPVTKELLLAALERCTPWEDS